jgi:hypothetical protein
VTIPWTILKIIHPKEVANISPLYLYVKIIALFFLLYYLDGKIRIKALFGHR